MGSAPYGSSCGVDTGIIDYKIGEAFAVVEDVQQHIASIEAVAASLTAIENLAGADFLSDPQAAQAVITAVQAARDLTLSAKVSAVAASVQASASAMTALALANGLYADTTAGLAAVDEGKYFLVVGTGNTYAVLYKKVSGVAVAQNVSIPSLNGLIANSSMYTPRTLPGFVFNFLDANGGSPVGLKEDGTWKAVALEAVTLNGVPVSSLGSGASGSSTALAGARYFAADIIHIVSYGQSLSIGVQAHPVITTTQRFDSLRFSGGVRAWDDSFNPYTSLVPLIETYNSDPTLVAGETPLSGATEAVKELIASEDGLAYTQHNFQLLASAPGFGATTIDDLDGPIPGGSGPQGYYSRFMDDVNAGRSLAAAAGKTYKCLAFLWLQGESDTGNTAYDTELTALRANISTDVKTRTGQSEDVICVAYEGTRQDTCLEFLQAAAADPKIYIALAMYPITRTADGVHMPALSSKLVGAYQGRVVKRVLVDQVGWKPLMPISHFRQGNIVEIRFHVPHGPLVFDTTNYVEQANKGFHLYQADGVTAIAINSVAITQPDTIRITASAAIPTGAKLRYGITDPTAHTATTGGNVRDSDPTIFDGGGLNLPLRNWCLCFEEIL